MTPSYRKKNFSLDLDSDCSYLESGGYSGDATGNKDKISSSMLRVWCSNSNPWQLYYIYHQYYSHTYPIVIFAAEVSSFDKLFHSIQFTYFDGLVKTSLDMHTTNDIY